MKQYLAITQYGCAVTVERERKPPDGITVHCIQHQREETAVSVQTAGWWVQCHRNDCTYFKPYATAANAVRYGMRHSHAPRIRIYYGTATLRLSDYTPQDTQGKLF